MIYQYSKENGLDFWKELDKYLEMIRSFHKKRYEMIANMPASSNPLAFTQGGLYKGTKKSTDKVGWDIVKSFTASLGLPHWMSYLFLLKVNDFMKLEALVLHTMFWHTST